jgi:transposase
MTRRRKKAKGRPTPERRELRLDELKAIIERTRGVLSVEDQQKLESALDTLVFLTHELESKGVTIHRLRQLIFGARTERTSDVLGEEPEAAAGEGEPAAGPAGEDETSAGSGPAKPKRKGHGRNGAATYHGAKKVKVAHEKYKAGDPCPLCPHGKLYLLEEPAVLVRVTGVAPLGATVYEKERLRCNPCGAVFPAASPPGVGEAKYDEPAAAMIGLLKYGCGLPFNRLERLESNLGIPLPAATQWEVVHRAAQTLAPVHEELIRQAAQGEVIHNDDTTAKVLALTAEAVQAAFAADAAAAGQPIEESTRKGVFTTGIVSRHEGRPIALFFTGHRHAGENLAALLARRARDLPPPIQMCDGLSSNLTDEFATILANCNAHARRRFVDVVDNFPEECRRVLETLRDVYRTDGVARKEQMSPEDRLRLHQAESSGPMEQLRKWMRQQLDAHIVEENSGLGEAMVYMLKHWDKLTLFLHVPGAPIDNNICERALKKAILHRKNALFYKTETGARVGDLFMSLIHTAELNGTAVFEYLVALLRHSEAIAAEPHKWMPWTYAEELARLDGAPVPSG